MSLFRDSHTKKVLVVTGVLMVFAAFSSCRGWTIAVIMSVIAMWGSIICYLHGREKLYRECIKTVEQFEEGDFSEHLPKNEEGSFYTLMSDVDRFAMTCKSLNETEKRNADLISSRIQDISHQLKTPLAALLMYNEIVEQEPDNAEVVAEFGKKSQSALERMQQLIQTLLVMTRFDAGSIRFEKEKYVMGELVREAVRELMIRAEKEQKKIVFSGREEDMMLCDRKWTMEAVSNIVKNSLDYTEPGGKIEIVWEEENGISRIKISDNGAGIKSEDVFHVFKRFYRSSDHKGNGIGLGLPLAKSIIEEQGGTILLNSIYGEGTSMTLSFLQERE